LSLVTTTVASVVAGSSACRRFAVPVTFVAKVAAGSA